MPARRRPLIVITVTVAVLAAGCAASVPTRPPGLSTAAGSSLPRSAPADQADPTGPATSSLRSALRSDRRITVAAPGRTTAGATGASAASPARPTAAAPATAQTLPDLLARTGGGTQVITVVADGASDGSRDGTLTWWQRRGGRWVAVGSAGARFGLAGLSDDRVEGDDTTPTGIFPLPTAFGIDPDPGTRMPWHVVDSGSWWDENSLDAHYNTWYEDCPPSICWESTTGSTHSSEHLIDYDPQYDYAVDIGFNTGPGQVRPPARPSGSGIFLHVSGAGYTAGCVSVSRSAMVSILRWLDPAAGPHIAIGTSTSIYRF